MTKEDKGDYTCVLKSTLGKRANFHRCSFQKSMMRNHVKKLKTADILSKFRCNHIARKKIYAKNLKNPKFQMFKMR